MSDQIVPATGAWLDGSAVPRRPPRYSRDPLTRLPRREWFAACLRRAAARVRREPDYAFALLFVDLDRFKAVNDAYGHLVGDRLLRAAAARMAGCLRSGDVIARRDGDEFTVLVDRLTRVEDAVWVARRIGGRLRAPFCRGPARMSITASIGIATSRQGLVTARSMLEAADRAMYCAKRAGGDRCVLFDPQGCPPLDGPAEDA